MAELLGVIPPYLGKKSHHGGFLAECGGIILLNPTLDDILPVLVKYTERER